MAKPDLEAGDKHRTPHNTQRIEIAFENLSYTVQAAPSADGSAAAGPPCCCRRGGLVDKHILSDISGVVSPGQFLAIIGASGSGKTTLLNTLANYTIPTSGRVLFNGQALKPRDRHAVAYVAQEDHLLPTSTVFDTLNLSAQLRLPRSWSPAQRSARVEELLTLLRLERQRDTLVGTANEFIRGISGGERKRLSIAVELIAYPSVIFLDEPTSGLDSKIAADVCAMLKDVACTGCTVLASVHQPSSEVFMQFDQLMVLSQGYALYQGAASGAVGYFGGLGPEVELVCPVHYNPSDFIMELTYNAVDASDGRITAASKISGKWTTAALSTEFQQRNRKSITTAVELHLQHTGEGVDQASRTDRASTCLAMSMLSQRAFRNILRNRRLLLVRIIQNVILSLLIAGIYGELDNSQEGLQSRQGVCFFLAMNQLMLAMMSVVHTFADERACFVRENRAGMYTTLSYYLSKVLVELPFQIILPTIMTVIVHPMLNLQGRIEVIGFFIILLTNVGQALGMIVGCAFKDRDVAMQVMPMFMMPMIIFGGLFVNVDTVPKWLSWAPDATPVKYAFNAILVEEFNHLGKLTCTTKQMKPDGSCPFDEGKAFVEMMGMSSSLEECAWVLFAIYCGARFITFFQLVRVSNAAQGS